MEYSLSVKNLTVTVEDKEVVKDVNLEIRPGEIHALMGPNGSGKSSLVYAIAGHTEYKVTNGKISLGDIDLLTLAPEERAKAGLFLSFQEPPEVGGVSMRVFLNVIKTGIGSLYTGIRSLEMVLGISDSFLDRFLNDGFSGGEKKKSEILQFLARKPKFAIFDEIDSGLDLDSLQVVADIIQSAAVGGTGVLLISHAPRMFSRIVPQRIHVLINGTIAASGGAEIISSLEKSGYDVFYRVGKFPEIVSVA